MFEAITRRWPRLELRVDEPVYRPNPILRGLSRLDLALGQAGPAASGAA